MAATTRSKRKLFELWRPSLENALSEKDASKVAWIFSCETWQARELALDKLGTEALLLCARRGHVSGVQRLLALGADPNKMAENGQCALHVSCMEGRVRVVEALVSHESIQVNVLSRNKSQPLHEVAASGSASTEIADLLLKAGAKKNAQDSLGATPAHWAARYLNIGILKQLLRAGANPSIRDSYGLCVFSIAVYSGQLDIVKCVYQYRPDILKDKNELGQLLGESIDRRPPRAIYRFLVNIGANLQYTENGQRKTQLHNAAASGSKRNVAFFLDEPSSRRLINSTNSYNNSPLVVACTQRSHSAVVSLIRHGALVNTVGQSGIPLLTATSKQNYSDCLRLLQAGASVHPENEEQELPLCVAAGNGNIKLCKLLVSWNADVNDRNTLAHGCPPLLHAVLGGHMETAKWLVQQGSTFTTSGNHCSVLQVAVKYFKKRHRPDNWTDLIDFLLQMEDSDIDFADQGGCTALYYARDADMVQKLLERGADPNIQPKSGDGFTPLMGAAFENNVDVCRELLAGGAKVNMRCFSSGGKMTAILLAARICSYSVTSLLVRHGASVNQADKAGRNLLSKAICSDKRDEEVIPLLRMLLEKGATQDPDKHGTFPMHLAAGFCRPEVLHVLVEYGADAEIRNLSGETPLHIAAKFGHWPIFLELFQKYGVNLDCADNHGWTPLHRAAKSGFESPVRCLLDIGASLDTVDSEGRTALMIACSADLSNDDEPPSSQRRSVFVVVNGLMKRGANVNIRTKRGLTALHFASINNRPDIAQALLLNGARINARTKHGRTALHCAARSGNAEVISMLASRGADINAYDKNNTSALLAAASRGHTECVRTLISHGAETGGLNSHSLLMMAEPKSGHHEQWDSKEHSPSKVDTRGNNSGGVPLNNAQTENTGDDDPAEANLKVTSNDPVDQSDVRMIAAACTSQSLSHSSDVGELSRDMLVGDFVQREDKDCKGGRRPICMRPG